MEAHALEWLNLATRWIHVIAAIMWIGDSFLFMWMDSHLSKPERPREGDVVGELYMVHSGGFYEVVKRRALRKEEVPNRLYWFKWESYTTWLSGFVLLAVVYWLGGAAFLVDPNVLDMSHGTAVALSLGLLVGGWIVYDLLWSSPLGKDIRVGAAISFVILVGLAYGLTHTFGGRAAYLQFGAMIGTVMAGNVFFRIIPAQKYMLAQTMAGEPVDTTLGLRAKKRSIQNHYLTLPVLFTMLSNHFPSTYGNEHAWLVLIALVVVGATLKYLMNFRGEGNKAVYAIGAAALASVVFITAPASLAGAEGQFAGHAKVEFAEAHTIVQHRCVSCHAAHPANPAFPQPPSGIVIETPKQMRDLADRILVRAVLTKTMPLANMTGMTDEERTKLGAWIAQGASTEGASAVAAKTPPPAAPAPIAYDSPAAEAKAIFATRCTVCHGEAGAGDGAAAATLTPKPRDLRDAAWHASVTDEHLRKVILLGGGAVGKSVLMPPQPDLETKPEVLDALVRHLRAFAATTAEASPTR